MPIRQTNALLAAAALLLAGCSNPLDAEIPVAEKEQHTYLEEVLPKLSPQEREVVTTYIVGSALDGQKIPTGQTARKVLEMHKADPDSIRNLGDSKTEKLVQITYSGKSVQPQAPEKGQAGDQQIFKLKLKNQGTQAIAGLEGLLNFKDLFGHTLASLSVQVYQTIEPGATIEWTGRREINPHTSAHVALRDVPEGKYTATFNIITVVLADGTKVKGP